MAEPGAADAYRAAEVAYELGAQVHRLRIENRWTQEQLAVAAGMTQSAVARFEAGAAVPTIPVLARLAKALSTELSVSFVDRPKAG
ncbi:hypothetical protein GCM10023223_38630 [Stackebrandtia albiflava]